MAKQNKSEIKKTNNISKLKTKSFEFLDHTADMKFISYGKDPSEAFKNAAYAIVSIITHTKIKPVILKKINVEGVDPQNLLYSFLENFLFLIDTENLIMAECKNITIKQNKPNSWKLSGEFYFDDIKKIQHFYRY